MDDKEIIKILYNLKITPKENDELSLKIIQRIKTLEKQRKFWQLILSLALEITILVNFIMGVKILNEELSLSRLDAVMISLIENWQLIWFFGSDALWAVWENLPINSFSLFLFNLVLILYVYRLIKNNKFIKFINKI